MQLFSRDYLVLVADVALGILASALGEAHYSKIFSKSNTFLLTTKGHGSTLVIVGVVRASCRAFAP